MKRRIKKAFTLVELLVVIAILAILSTVAIVGYNAFTEKAEISADEQAVTQMNKVLEAYDVDGETIDSPMEAAKVLAENGYNGDFSTYHSEYEIVWILSENRMALMKNNKIVYPEAYTDITYDPTNVFYILDDLPSAETSRLNTQDVLNLLGEMGNDVTDPDVIAMAESVDGAMKFSTNDTLADIEKAFYKNYYVDFVLRSNKDINLTADFIGYYPSVGMYGQTITDLEMEEDATYNVMKDYLFAIDYEFIVDFVQEFYCAIAVSEDTKLAYPGLELTLELWMYEDYDETANKYLGESYLIGTPYTFEIN